MGDPITTGLLVASTALSAAGSVASGAASRAAAKSEAAQMDENAKVARLQGKQEANAIREESDRIAARNRALRAVSGLDSSSGSFRSIQTEVRESGESDARNAEFNAISEGARYELQAKNTRAAGNAAFISGLFGGATSLLSGASKYKKATGNSLVKTGGGTTRNFGPSGVP